MASAIQFAKIPNSGSVNQEGSSSDSSNPFSTPREAKDVAYAAPADETFNGQQQQQQYNQHHHHQEQQSSVTSSFSAIHLNDNGPQQQQAVRLAPSYQQSSLQCALPDGLEFSQTSASGQFVHQHQQQKQTDFVSDNLTLEQYHAAPESFHNFNGSSVPRYSSHSYPQQQQQLSGATSQNQFALAAQYSHYSQQPTHQPTRALNYYCVPTPSASNNLYDQPYTSASGHDHSTGCYQANGTNPNYYESQAINNYQTISASYNIHHHHHNHHYLGYSRHQQQHHYSDGTLQQSLTGDSSCPAEQAPLVYSDAIYSAPSDQHELYSASNQVADQTDLQNDVKPKQADQADHSKAIKQTIGRLVQERQSSLGVSRDQSIPRLRTKTDTTSFSSAPEAAVAKKVTPVQLPNGQQDAKEANKTLDDKLLLHRQQKFVIQRINHCDICGRNYARPSTLKTHLRTHTNERPYKCKICGKTFSQAANLTAHQRVHTGERPFFCPVCRRPFSQSSSVITHLRTHSGERPYRCHLCQRTFSDSSTLTKHCRIHSGEKPYRCEFCPLNFSQSGNLSRHIKLHLTGSLIKERVIDSGNRSGATKPRSTKAGSSAHSSALSSSSSSTTSSSSLSSASHVGAVRNIYA